MTNTAPAPKWLLLLLQLPTKPAAARIKTWRRLQQLGSVAIKNSVYVLPNTAQAREDFEWLRAEVLAAKGQASIMIADALTEHEDEEIRTAFLNQRASEYDAVRGEIDKVLRGPRARVAGPARLAAERALRGGREEIARLDAMELIPAAARAKAVDAIERLEARLAPDDERIPAMPAAATTSHDTYHARTWVTRPRPGVDRMSSAWLIQRFIDPKARFDFSAAPPPAGEKKRVAFDMFGAAFGHQGDRCSFEVLCDHFGIDDKAVRQIAKLVHDVDLKDQRYSLPEAPVVARMVEGLRATYADDNDLLTHGMAMFAALYESLRSTAPSPGRRKRKKR
ncbi:MAG TPA: chromate resistance protein ChrB domain-containing protein [Vicinamibacterales bacterium]|nr:chromate resistance protein ChrB domain-containing protein [Vicinamibacterales bacterium]